MSDNNRYKIKSIKYNLVMNILLKMSAVIFPLIAFPYASRILGADSYGRVGFAISVTSYFSLLASLGIPSYAVRKCAQVRDDEYNLGKTVKEILLINTISLCITCCLFIICLFLVPRFYNDKLLIMLASSSIILQTFGVEWFYQAIEQYDYITIRSIIVRIISLVLLFLFVKKPEDYMFYCLVTVIGTVGSNVVNILKLPKLIDLKKKYKLELSIHFKPIFVLFFYYAATTIYTNLDVVMLGFMTDNSTVGYYNASVKIKNVLVSVITALGAVALPRASYYLSNDLMENFKNLIKKSLNYVLFVSVSLAVFFTMLSKNVILFLAGKGFEQSISSMMFITPAIIFIGIGSITAWQLLIPLRRDKYTLYGAVIGAMLDLCINFWLIPKYGATGASIGTLVAEVCVVCIHIIGLRDIILDVWDVKNTIKILIGSLISFLVLIIFGLFLRIENNLICIIIKGLFFFGIYFICEMIFREKSVIELCDVIKSKIRLLNN